MHKGRGYRRQIPPDPNLEMQPYGCAPVRMNPAGGFDYAGGVLTIPTGTISEPCNFSYALMKYQWRSTFSVGLVDFVLFFSQFVRGNGPTFDFDLLLVDPFANSLAFGWFDKPAPTLGWRGFAGIHVGPPDVVASSPPFGTGFGMQFFPVDYHDEP